MIFCSLVAIYYSALFKIKSMSIQVLSANYHKEREGEGGRDRQTDRQTDRDRERETETDRHTDRQIEKKKKNP